MKQTTIKLDLLRMTVGVVVWACIVTGFGLTVEAIQPGTVTKGKAVNIDFQDLEDGDDLDEDMLSGDGKYLGGAPLKTDPDLMARLQKADEYRKDGNYRVASRLWQSVLGESGDILFTEDGETYLALTERVESILAELPASGLSSYRISADASAKEILAQSVGDYDLDKLAQVVKNYFMSSVGDDAAFRLGCIYLDRYDFVGAARLLRKITDQYPDPSVPLDEVWLRIAIAYCYIGDLDSANEAVARATQAGGDRESRLFESVLALIADTPQLNRDTGINSQWTTRLGTVKRNGVMPSLPEGYDSGPLKADWQFCFEPKNQYKNDSYAGQTFIGFDGVADSVQAAEEKMIKSWRKGEWRPAGTLLFSEDYTIFKTGADVSVWNRDPERGIAWRPLWLNQFAIDDATRTWKEIYDAYGRYNNAGDSSSVPSQVHEIQLFGDQIAQAMSTHRGVLYNIEGKEYSWSDRKLPNVNRGGNYSWGSVPRRTRTNRLVAYNLDNGKIMWSLPTQALLVESTKDDEGKPDEDDSEASTTFEDVGFMAAPVGFGDLLLAPVNVSGSVWIYALDSKNQGELVWKSYLCDEPGGGSQPWSPIHISIDGSTAYANCGTGVVFAVDPMTGGIRFARRYSRTGKKNNFMERFGGQLDLLELDGWMEDLAIPVGNELIIFASDHNVVWAIDRQTGAFRWKTENRPFGNKFDYLIGMEGDYIYIGGPQSVAAISITAQGRWEWVHSFSGDQSLGRAMLTRDGIYVPLEKKIVKLGLQGKQGSGDVQSEMQVRLGVDAPLGNLYSDGQRIWVVGGNRLFALGRDDESTAAAPATADRSTETTETTAVDPSQPDADSKAAGTINR